MKMKVIAMLAALSLTASAAAAQELPRKVNNVEVLDLDGAPFCYPARATLLNGSFLALPANARWREQLLALARGE